VVHPPVALTLALVQPVSVIRPTLAVLWAAAGQTRRQQPVLRQARREAEAARAKVTFKGRLRPPWGVLIKPLKTN
jgi:hypothetical protein